MLFPNPFVYQRTLEADIKSATIPSMLEQHYGQCGEDLIIFSIARVLQTQGHIGNWADYVYVEIGGNHAFAGNNTYLLHICTGMTGILVEANPALLPDLQEGRHHQRRRGNGGIIRFQSSRAFIAAQRVY